MPTPTVTVADRGSTFALVQHEPRPLEVADVESSNGWREGAANEVTGPVSNGEEQRGRQPSQGETSETVTAPTPGTSASPPPEPAPAEPPAAAAPKDAEQEQREDGDRHMDSVLQAAAIASTRVICHRNTWSFLIEQTPQHPRFRLPERINDLDDGMIETFLSGRSVLAVLVTMRKVSDDYLAVTTIVLDDRPLATGEAAWPTGRRQAPRSRTETGPYGGTAGVRKQPRRGGIPARSATCVWS
ncbi:hypothetical protein [Streptomyces sp. NPDC096311]|uniref:hypothetical protein n=1 Tax=Streptomyces sp. NPDC096311 TaxID=3366083 RepID=UPI0038282E5D